jgi:ADP-L-glycero-D-manno-heptose 6-epimerase
MPDNLRKQYQYFTQARVDKLKQEGYKNRFHTLEAGIEDYVTQYLNTHDPYL